LRGTVEDLIERGEYAERVREYRSLVAKRAALQAEKHPDELDDSEAYADLERRIDAVEATLDEDRERLTDDTEFVSALRDLTAPEGDGHEDFDAPDSSGGDSDAPDGETDAPDGETDAPDGEPDASRGDTDGDPGGSGDGPGGPGGAPTNGGDRP